MLRRSYEFNAWVAMENFDQRILGGRKVRNTGQI
jgi:hypothetical protein